MPPIDIIKVIASFVFLVLFATFMASTFVHLRAAVLTVAEVGILEIVNGAAIAAGSVRYHSEI
jgi:hypothetical protein